MILYVYIMCCIHIPIPVICIYRYDQIWGWINTNYHQKWVGEHPHKDYSIHFWDVHQGYLVLTHSHLAFFVFFFDMLRILSKIYCAEGTKA